MSYYFAIVGTKDNPIFEHEFGTSKSGGDGNARFSDQQRHLNQFIVHAALDVVEEVQWANGNMYLKSIDRHQNTYITSFITGTNIKFMLLHLPSPATGSATTSRSGSAASAARQAPYSASSAATTATYNPSTPAIEEAQKNFFLEVYDVWAKTLMNPFYTVNAPIRSPVFRARIAGAARKYL